MFWERLRETLPLRFRSLFRRRCVEQELEDEFQFHLEQRIQQEIAAGRSPEEARYVAIRAMDGMAQRQEECRDARRINLLDQFAQDLRYALRGQRRDPILALAAGLTLAICIAANTTVFSIVHSILLRPLPYPGSERLYWISERMGRNQGEVGLAADYYSLRDQNRVFEDVGALDSITVNWTGREKPEQLTISSVTPSFFHVMGAQPMLGRYLAHNEAGTKSPAVVVLSYPFWRNRLGRDSNIVGKTITLDRLPRTVIGVMPQGFEFPTGTQLWKPIDDMDEGVQRARRPDRPMRLLNIIAKAKPGVGEAQLASEMSRLTRAIHAEYPKEFRMAGFLDQMNISAIGLQQRLSGDLRPALLILSAAVGLVLLIACANMANLLLARATARNRELAVRVALGSDRGRIIRQVFTESLALAVPGGLAGIALAAFAVSGLNVWKPPLLASHPQIALDLPVLLFTLGLTLITGLIFGMAPAFAAANVSIQDALKGAGYTQSSGNRTARVRQWLVVAELGVSLILLIGAGLLTRSFLNLAHTELGFRAENLLTLRLNLAGSLYAKGGTQAQFYQNVLDRVRQLPMVRSAALASDLPLTMYTYSTQTFQVLGRAPVPMAQRPHAPISVVSREFFETVGIPLRSGRLFSVQGGSEPGDGILVDEAFARRIFPGTNALGQRIYFGSKDETKWTVMGIVGTVRNNALGAEPAGVIYRCDCQSPDHPFNRMRLIVRTRGDPHAAVTAIEGQVYAVDRNQPVFDVKTMEERLAELLAPQRFYLALMGAFAGIAILLAAVGIYGVMSYLVTRRTREFGIRMALGAQPQHVLRLVTRESVALVAIAAIAGLAGAWMLTRYLKSMLYGVTVLDAPTFVITPLVLAAIAMAASLAPARRAARIDPVIALREE